MRKRIFFEILFSLAFVYIGTLFFYGRLESIGPFWNAQAIWSIILAIGWLIVSLGYFHQGWLVQKTQEADDVSMLLPPAVFFIQCILFIKGIYYNDWSLIWGALVVNSGVIFSLYNIFRVRHLRNYRSK